MTTFVYVSPGPRSTDITTLNNGKYTRRVKEYNLVESFLNDILEPKVVFVEDNLAMEGQHVYKKLNCEAYLVKCTRESKDGIYYWKNQYENNKLI